MPAPFPLYTPEPGTEREASLHRKAVHKGLQAVTPTPQGHSLQLLQRSMDQPTPPPVPYSSTTTPAPEPPLSRAPLGLQESSALRCPACYSGGGREIIGTWCHEPLTP